MVPIQSYLENPEIFRLNKRKAHSDHKHYSSVEDYLEKKDELYLSLCGEWDLLFSETVEGREKDFYREDFSSDNFKKIKVPGHAELQGFGKIQYINTMYPWEGHEMLRPPMVPKENNVLSYVRYFDLKETQKNKRIVLRFEGVETAMVVYLNGHFVGYSEDSFSLSEFEITKYVREKDNKLALEVFKRSSASYLEDQDFFRFSGIFRPVILYALPLCHIDDFFADCSLEGKNKGIMDLSLSLSFCSSFNGSIEILLKDGLNVLFSRMVEISDEEKDISLDRITLENIHAYSNNNPYLYTLLMTVRDNKGDVVEIVPYKIGFRRIEIIDGVIYLNGERLIICGVNRHEWNPYKGRAIDISDMKKDIEIFKKNNINAVRTSHYPNNIAFYSLCDENGIYMMAETNLESHGSWQKMGKIEPSWNVPGDNKLWFKAVLDRAKNNFQSFKNHPSILFWSLGNESYAGEGLKLMNDYFKTHDTNRLVHYEGVFNYPEMREVISDVESQMYAPPERIREYFKNGGKKPFILCEYMHSMGNSLGGFSSYDELLDEFASFQGGFIWDFIDQALYVYDEITGRDVLRYGRDFSEKCSDYEFSLNGILFATRDEKPCMEEVRYFYGNRIGRSNVGNH